MRKSPSEPGWGRDNAQWSLERVAIGWTIEAMRTEGLVVGEGWSPDRDGSKLPERRRRPDWYCDVNGIPTAIEHSTFLTRARGRAWARAAAETKRDPSRILGVYSIAGAADDRTFDAFLIATVAKKGTQHAEWGRGILVVSHNLDQPAHKLSEAIARHGGIPWWRVYWIGRSPPAELVWDRP